LGQYLKDARYDSSKESRRSRAVRYAAAADQGDAPGDINLDLADVGGKAGAATH
jgi:hypothetical protein